MKRKQIKSKGRTLSCQRLPCVKGGAEKNEADELSLRGGRDYHKASPFVMTPAAHTCNPLFVSLRGVGDAAANRT